MRLFTKNMAALTLPGCVALEGAGCEKSAQRLRPDMDTVMTAIAGPKARPAWMASASARIFCIATHRAESIPGDDG